MTPDLFGAPPLPGLKLGEELVSPAEEAELIRRIGEVELTPFRFRGFEGRRLTRSFGWLYDFEAQSFMQAEPIPEWLLPVRDRAATFAEIPAGALVHALLIRYDPGAGIGWHKDRPVFDQVVGISLGAPAIMSFRRRSAGGFERFKLPLPPRSGYLLSGPVRHDWEHGIAEHADLRFSITFRSLSDATRRPLEQR